MSNKYGAIPVRTEEGRFDSTGEYNRWCELKLLAKAGQIQDLRRQVPFPLHTAGGGGEVGRYVADFTYTENGKKTIEDFKGVISALSKWKMKHASLEHGIDVRISRARKR